MTYPTPTLEAFLTQTEADEDTEELPTEVIGTGGALDSIARSMEALVSLVQRLDGETADAAGLREDLELLRRDYGQLVEEDAAKKALIDQVLEVCRPSRSKLANSIRAVLEPAQAPAEGVGTTGEELAALGVVSGANASDAPANDAPVEEWREYARGCGYQGPDVDKANRSQIRTMLGIPQPTTD